MRSLAQIELDIQNLQQRRAVICQESTCCEGTEYAALLKELANVDAKLKRRFDRRALLRAERHATGMGFLGNYSRG
jgi:hypothetical protein